jgi:hypothetical protein
LQQFNAKGDAMYFRHKQFGHIVQADAIQPAKGDCFAGTVIAAYDDESIAVGTHSTVWMRAAFERTNRVATPVATCADTVAAMQYELDMLRVALGVDDCPLDTLPSRMLHAAQSYRRLYEKVKAWEAES